MRGKREGEEDSERLREILFRSWSSLDIVHYSCKYRHAGDKQDPDTVPFCKDFQSDRYIHSSELGSNDGLHQMINQHLKISFPSNKSIK